MKTLATSRYDMEKARPLEPAARFLSRISILLLPCLLLACRDPISETAEQGLQTEPGPGPEASPQLETWTEEILRVEARDGIEIEGSAPLRLETLLQRDEFLDLVAEQGGIDLEVTVLEEGEILRRTDSFDGVSGPEPVPLLCREERCSYELAFEVLKAEKDGTYRLRAPPSRPASQEDRLRERAEAEIHRGKATSSADEARRAFEAALSSLLAASRPDLRRVADVRYRLARELWSESRQEEAVAQLALAFDAFDRQGRARRAIAALNNLSRYHRELGRTGEARKAAQEALERSEREDFEDGLLLALRNLGLSYQRESYEEARKRHEQRLARARTPKKKAESLLDLGLLDRTWGEYRSALERFEEAREQMTPKGNEELWANLLYGMGVAEAELGELDRLRHGIGQVQEALELFERVGDVRDRAVAHADLGRLLWITGRADEARRHLRSVLELPGLKEERTRAAASLHLAWLDFEAGFLETAEDHLQKARSTFDDLGDEEGLFEAQMLQARILRGQGKLHQAVKAGRQGLRRIEDRRRQARRGIRIRYLSSKRPHFDFLLDLALELDQTDPGQDHGAWAFALVEQRRARTFYERLGAAQSLERHEAVRRIEKAELELLERLENLSFSLEGEALLGIDPGMEPALEPFRPITPREARALAPERTLFLVYALADPASHLWVVGPGFDERHTLPGQRELEEKIRTTLRLLDDKKRNRRAVIPLRELGEILLGPVLPHLEAYSRIRIVADGLLNHLPFATLVRPGAGDVALVETHVLSQAPSVSFLRRLEEESCRREPAPETLALIVPDAGGRDLPGAAREAERLESRVDPAHSRVLKGSEATVDNVLGAGLRDYRLLAFAAHGYFDPKEPESSGIRLASPEPDRSEAGILSLEEIEGLELRADLVVLSSCESALGDLVWGEGSVSLARSFLEAGAAGVLASFWEVDDRATEVLMGHFYEILLEERLDPAAALRRAQLRLRQEARWARPYYWGAFTLLGGCNGALRRGPLHLSRTAGTPSASAKPGADEKGAPNASIRKRDEPPRPGDR